MLGSACKEAPASVDCILERLPWGNVAFNTPEEMRLDSVYAIALRLSPTIPIDTQAIQALVGDSAATVGLARVRFTKRMSASLRGNGFEIDPPPSESSVIAVSETAPTDWSWQVTPKRTGKLLLTLALDAQLIVDGRDAAHPYRVFSRTIQVHATWGQRGEKLVQFLKEYWALLAGVASLLVAGVLRFWPSKRRAVGFTNP